MSIRPPAVAGLFYPADPERLRAAVAELLAGAPASAGPAPKALIAPHAGYVYSGEVAAAAFATLRNAPPGIERVVVIGPAHYVPVARDRGADRRCVRDAARPRAGRPATRSRPSPICRSSSPADAAHAPEHALEVELPFLQALLGAISRSCRCWSATPLREQVADVLRRLWGGPETLIVVSSDLSHYHDYDTARRLDAATAARDRARRLGAARPERRLRLPPDCRPPHGGATPRPRGAAACACAIPATRPATARPRRRLRRVDVRADVAGRLMGFRGFGARGQGMADGRRRLAENAHALFLLSVITRLGCRRLRQAAALHRRNAGRKSHAWAGGTSHSGLRTATRSADRRR